MEYSYTDFENSLNKLQPRFADRYIVPAVLIVSGLKGGKKPLNKWARRILFTAGVYTAMRNYKVYKENVLTLQKNISHEKA